MILRTSICPIVNSYEVRDGSQLSELSGHALSSDGSRIDHRLVFNIEQSRHLSALILNKDKECISTNADFRTHNTDDLEVSVPPRLRRGNPPEEERHEPISDKRSTSEPRGTRGD